MLEWLFGVKGNKTLDTYIQRIERNMENNYKDAAQMNLKELEEAYNELVTAGKLNDKQKAHYSDRISSFKSRMKNFTHKDQKPYWV